LVSVFVAVPGNRNVISIVFVVVPGKKNGIDICFCCCSW
jgi:hypothetical protein